MWLSVLNWFLAILSLGIWIGTYIIYEKGRCMAWFDNKFGKDDPMPPSPKQQEEKLNLGEGSSVTVETKTTSNQQDK